MQLNCLTVMFLFVSKNIPSISRSIRLNHSSSSSSSKAFDVISSTKSITAKHIISLILKRKNRIEAGQTVVEGPRMIIDLLRNKDTANLVQKILISEEKWESFYPTLVETNTGAERLPDIHPASEAVMKACTDTVTPQGIVAIVDVPNLEIPVTSTPSVLVLDAVADPGNLGTLLRSSVATGVSAVYLLPGSCDPWNPKAVRSAMGSSFLVPIRQVDSWDACCHELQTLGCHYIWAATMVDDNAPGTCYYSVNWTRPHALIVGNEGNGLTDDIRQALAQGKVKPVYVPMQAGVESLNAAVCGSIILFERQRQLQIAEQGNAMG